MTRYEPAIDLESIEAIDTHVHIEVDAHGHSSLPADLQEAASRYFRTDGPRPDLDAIAAYYRQRRMAAVVFTVDATTNLGQPPISSADIAEGAARNNDVLADAVTGDDGLARFGGPLLRGDGPVAPVALHAQLGDDLVALDLEAASFDLSDRGVHRLMVEGGAAVHAEFLTAGLVDELQLVVAPFLVGDPDAPRFAGGGALPWPSDRRMTVAEVRKIDDVVLLRYLLSDRFEVPV